MDLSLLESLKYKLEVAKKYTKNNFIDRVKEEVELYENKSKGLSDLIRAGRFIDVVDSRYKTKSKMIFYNHESMMASLFDTVPDLIFSPKGERDENAKDVVYASYEYLKDKLDLFTFMNDAAWWLILSGFTVSTQKYLREGRMSEVIGDDGEVMLDEEGKPIKLPVLDYDDPVVDVFDPDKFYFSPESEFSVDAKKIPYSIEWALMDTQEIKQVFGKDVKSEDNHSLTDDIYEDEDKQKKYFKRCKVYFYRGTVDYDYRKKVKDWSPDQRYYIVFTDNEIIHKEKLDRCNMSLCKWYGAPNKFFGFGIAQLIKDLQKEEETRTEQMMRYADIAAYPKMAVDSTADFDQKAARDPRALVFLRYAEKKPEYLSPPQMNDLVFSLADKAPQKAQQIVGILDIGTGAQQSTVKTATGQSMFADAAERRMRLVKKKFSLFYRQTVINLLKLAQENWAEEKTMKITDEDGEEKNIVLTAEALSTVDFDMDVDIDSENITVNKDVLRAQAIEMYNISKDDPIVDRKKIFINLLKTGFNIQNANQYINETSLEPGMVLVDTQTGMQFMVDDSGQVVEYEDEQQTAEPTGDQGGNIPTDQMGIMSQNITNTGGM